MKAIILSAGAGSRLGDLTKEIPKSLVDVNGKSIIQRQIETFLNNGIKEIIVIVGPHKEKFQLNDVEYVIDKNFHEHEQLSSLMKASKYFQNDIVISFGDVIVDDKIMKQIVESTNEFGIAVDLKWEKNYVNRDQHPKSEAENVLFDKEGNVLEIKKNIQKQDSKIGEYLGVMKLSRKNSKVFLDKYSELKISHQGKFHNAASLESAYLTDMFQELIDSGIRISPIYVSGKWCEIDTPQDLKNAQKIFEE
tara:strand:+ start:160 stop:909 length:750 start_codon:yes stop_codon:yes gene_type:complete